MSDRSRRNRASEESAASTGGTGSTGASVVSRSLWIDGDCETTGWLRIEGKITGSVRARRLEVAAGGTVEGDVGVPESGDGTAKGEEVVVGGTVLGEARGSRVEVGADGRIEGGIQAAEAIVHGHVRGGIVAERRLVLEKTAVVEGDVRAPRIALKEGGWVQGNIRMGEPASEPATDRENRSSETIEATLGPDSAPEAPADRKTGRRER